MKTTNMKVLSTVLFSTFVLLLPRIHAADADQDGKHISKSFTVQSGGRLTLEADLGSIEVKTVPGNKLDVDVAIEFDSWSSRRKKEFLSDFDVQFTETAGGVDIKAEYKHGHSTFWDNIGGHARVRFVITVPIKYNVDLSTSGGGISVADLEGEVQAKTSGGSLNFGSIQGPIVGRTSGGGISLKECNGQADVRTSGGSIHLGKVNGNVDAHTSGGSIEVQEMFGIVNASTSGGSITVNLREQPRENCRLTTSGGSIHVHLSEKIGLNVDASTSGGGVSTDFPVTVQGEIDKHSLKAQINGGGPELFLRTSGGSIRLKKMLL